MPDTRTHRGPAPGDRDLFGASLWPRLREAMDDLSWLRGRGYAEASSLKLVGDRHALDERQRMAVRRSACPDEALARRLRHERPVESLRGRPLAIDGFNLLTTIEAALGGAVILRGRDGCARDLAGVHGTYRKVEETRPAVVLVGEYLAEHGIGPCRWYLDSPVSNSGRLRGIILGIAGERGWDWGIELVFNPDPILASSSEAVATADAGILDLCAGWLNLAWLAIEEAIPGAWVVDLRGPDRRGSTRGRGGEEDRNPEFKRLDSI